MTGDAVRCVADQGSDPDGDMITWRFVWTLDGSTVPGDSEYLEADIAEGDTIRCEAFPHDGVVEGPSATASATVGNAPPRITGVAISPAQPVTGEPLLCAHTGFSDPEGDSDQSTYAWSGGPCAGSSGPTLDGVCVVRPDLISCEVTPADATGQGPPVSADVTVGNATPTITILALEPSAPVTGETITCTAESEDPEDDPVTIVLSWAIDGVPTPGAPLVAARGERVVCTAAPSDSGPGEPASVEVVVGNAAPSAAGAGITPPDPFGGEELTCAVLGFSDPEGDADASTYRWSVGGALHSGAVLPGDLVAGGLPITCTATPSDGQAVGAVQPVSVTPGNGPPSITSVTISPLHPTADSLMSCSWTFADPEDDPDASSFVWWVDGISAGSDPLLPGPWAPDQAIRCEVTPHDGQQPGEPVSTTVVVGNSAPVAPEIEITPQDAEAGSAPLVCAVTVPADDPDADPITYTWAWTHGGVFAGHEDADETSTVPAGLVTSGTWTCCVTADDGELSTSEVCTSASVIPAPGESTCLSDLRGRLAVVVDDGVGESLWVAHADGAAPTLLVEHHPGGIATPSWSASGARLLFADGDPRSVSAGGGPLDAFPYFADCQGVSWAPDGRVARVCISIIPYFHTVALGEVGARDVSPDHDAPRSPAYAPTGDWLAWAGGDNDNPYAIHHQEERSGAGTARLALTAGHVDPDKITWSAEAVGDARAGGLYYASTDTPSRLFHVDFLGQALTQITFHDGDHADPERAGDHCLYFTTDTGDGPRLAVYDLAEDAWQEVPAPEGDVVAIAFTETPDSFTDAPWSSSGSMVVPRIDAATVQLPDGSVLVAGGTTLHGAAVETLERWSGSWSTVSVDATWDRTGGALTLRRQWGDVLWFGGRSAGGALAGEIHTFDIDPTFGGWTTWADPLITPRESFAHAALPDGRVLIVGGTAQAGPTAAVELLDPTAESIAAALPMGEARVAPALVALIDGRVLVAGGEGEFGPLDSAEVFDPADGSWTSVDPMTVPRAGFSLATLPDGRVLAAGGTTTDGTTRRADLFDLDTGSWCATAPMSLPRRTAGSLLVLDNGQVLAGGGLTDDGVAAELYDPEAGDWQPAPSWSRAGETPTALFQAQDGSVVAAGGASGAVFHPGTDRFLRPGDRVGGLGVGASEGVCVLPEEVDPEPEPEDTGDTGAPSDVDLWADPPAHGAIVVGQGVTCVRRADDTVGCWGRTRAARPARQAARSSHWPRVDRAASARCVRTGARSAGATSTGTRPRGCGSES